MMTAQGSRLKADGRSKASSGRSGKSLRSAAKSFASFASNTLSAAGSVMHPVPQDPIEAMVYGLRRLDADALNLDVEGLVRDVDQSDALRSACAPYAPNLHLHRSGRTSIEPEAALLSYHQMSHKRRVYHAKNRAANVPAHTVAYTYALEELVKLAVVDFRLRRLDTLVGDLVRAGSEMRRKRSRAENKGLPAPMSLDKARWCARVYAYKKMEGSSLLLLETSHFGDAFLDIKALQLEYLAQIEVVKRLEGFGVSYSDSALRKENKKLSLLMEQLANAQAGIGITVTDLDHLVDKVVVADDEAMREHMLTWPALREELASPKARDRMPGTASDGERLVHLLHTSGVAGNLERQATKLVEDAGSVAVPVPALNYRYRISFKEDNGKNGPVNQLKWCFRGDELDSMVSRVQTLGVTNLSDLMGAVSPGPGQSISPGFLLHMQKLFREVVSAAEKDPVFCRQLQSIWSGRHKFALGSCKNDGRENYRAAHPEVAELAIHRLELMVDAHNIARGDCDTDPAALAKKSLRHFRCSMLVRPWCEGLGIPRRAEVRYPGVHGGIQHPAVSTTLPQQHSENFGTLQGLPALDDTLAAKQPHMGTVSTKILRTWHALSDSLGLGIYQHFEYVPLVDPQPVKLVRDQEVDNLYRARVMAERDCDAVEEALSTRCGELKKEVLDTKLGVFMDWATQWPPLLAAFGRIQPEAHVLKAAEKSGDDDPGIDKMLEAVKARKALGAFFKEQGTLVVLGQEG
jgi:hypothetical protein